MGVLIIIVALSSGQFSFFQPISLFLLPVVFLFHVLYLVLQMHQQLFDFIVLRKVGNLIVLEEI